MASANSSDATIALDYDTVLRPKILAELRSVKELSWASFSLMKDSDSYVLKITSDKATDPRWKEVSHALMTVLEQEHKHSIQVKIEQTRNFTETRFVAPRTAQPYNRQSKNPFGVYSLGRSIGVEQLDGPGTLGGFITVSYKGSTRVYGLTNNHVVNVGRTTNKQPASPTWVEKENTIYCPNYHDLEATKVQQGDQKIQSYKLGTVYQASGRTLTLLPGTADYCILDWALIALNSPTLEHMKEVDRKLKPNFQIPRTEREGLNNPFPASITYDPNVRIVADMTVFKWGRTTGVRRGVVNMTRKSMNVAQVEQWKGTLDNPAKVAIVTEWVVPMRNQQTLCEPGDSGSLVTDDQGHVVGILWGLTDDDTIVTDIRVVFENIRAKLGMDDGAVFGVATKF